MPIHDLSYRHWSGEWTSHPYRWWVITRQGIGLLVQKKRFILLMILSALPFVVRSVMLYLATVLGKSGIIKVDARFFEQFLTQQNFFTFIITIYAGAGLIANDLKVNALQIYLSKPITRRDYFIGKLGVLVFFLALPTLLPGILLFFLAVIFESDLTFLEQNYWAIGSIIAYSFAIIFTYALLILALSSLTRSSRFAGVNFAAVFFFSQILYAILSAILHTSRVAWVSLGNNLELVGNFFFGATPRYQSPTWLSVVILGALITAGTWVVHRRVQAVEVVK
jgi:ABC-type transport system involved in multi-copper enzyme maturation permease subunit